MASGLGSAGRIVDPRSCRIFLFASMHGVFVWRLIFVAGMDDRPDFGEDITPRELAGLVVCSHPTGLSFLHYTQFFSQSPASMVPGRRDVL